MRYDAPEFRQAVAAISWWRRREPKRSDQMYLNAAEARP